MFGLVFNHVIFSPFSVCILLSQLWLGTFGDSVPVTYELTKYPVLQVSNNPILCCQYAWVCGGGSVGFPGCGVPTGCYPSCVYNSGWHISYGSSSTTSCGITCGAQGNYT